MQSEVIKVDTAARQVVIRHGEEEYPESYDALLLSPGAQPLRPPIPGIDHERIVTLRNVPDAAVLKKLAGNYPQGRAVVVGGGESAGPGPVRDIGGSSTPYSGSF